MSTHGEFIRGTTWPAFVLVFCLLLGATALAQVAEDPSAPSSRVGPAASVPPSGPQTAAAPIEGGAAMPAHEIAAKPGHATTAATPAVFAFNHKAHLERGSSCADCHDVAQERTLRMPKMENCTTCHAVDRATVGPECRQCHTLAKGAVTPIRWTLAPMMPGVRFNHQKHTVTVKLECKTCHAGIEESDRVTPALMPSMKLCMDCHHQRGEKATSCRVCHTEEQKKMRPNSHKEGNWLLLHGKQVRRGSSRPLPQRCDFCHKQSECSTCHQDTPPRNHTNQFRIRGHGLIAAMDRDKCLTCHQQDACIRCHQTTPPATGPNAHRAGFGAPQDRHCMSCHFTSGLRRNCDTCHKGQPSHQQAPVPPPAIPAHRASNPASNNCRLCHRPGAGLLHADAGFDCRICHRLTP